MPFKPSPISVRVGQILCRSVSSPDWWGVARTPSPFLLAAGILFSARSVTSALLHVGLFVTPIWSNLPLLGSDGLAVRSSVFAFSQWSSTSSFSPIRFQRDELL